MVKGLTELELDYRVERTQETSKLKDYLYSDEQDGFKKIYNKALDSVKHAEKNAGSEVNYCYSMYDARAKEIYSYMSSGNEYKG